MIQPAGLTIYSEGDMSNELEKISSFRYQLAIAETYEDIKDIDNKASVLAELLKRDKFSLEKQNELGMFRIQLEEKKGKWLLDNFPHGINQHTRGGSGGEPPKMPVDKHESSRARRITNAKPEYKTQIINTIIKSGDVVTPGKVEQELKRNEKENKQREKKETYQEAILKEPKSNMYIDIYNTDKKFRIIYADPPWEYNDKQDIPNLGGAKKHYKTMNIKELCSLPIKDITEKDSILFLWITSPNLDLFVLLMESWGYKYKTSFVWDKIKHNMGHYNSVRHEFLLIGGKGKSTPDEKKLFDSVVSIERTEKHSEKPEWFAEMIDTLYTHGNRIELFSRNPKRNGWNFWGDES